MTHPVSSTVFDHKGKFVTLVHVPAAFTPLAITRDQIWGRLTDSLDVQYAVGYRLQK